MQSYKTEYKDYKDYAAIMISTDRMIWNERSAVRARMIEYAKQYKELHIIIFSASHETEQIAENAFIYSTNSFSKFNYIKNAYKVGKKILKSIAKTEKILISCQDPFETGLAGKKLANLRNDSELLLQIHTDLFSPYFTSKHIGIKNAFFNTIRLYFSKFTLPDAQAIRVVSKKIADSLVARGIDKDKIIVKPIGVNVDYIKSAAPAFDLKGKFPQFKKIIVMICRLEPEKNVEMALEAMKILNEKKDETGDRTVAEIGLIIVGSGSLMNSLKKFTYKLAIDKNVIFEGWQTDTIPYYKGCGALLVTSWYEGYGMIFKEGQAANCKIVSTDVGIAREVGAEIVDWKKEDIAEKLIQILK